MNRVSALPRATIEKSTTGWKLDGFLVALLRFGGGHVGIGRGEGIWYAIVRHEKVKGFVREEKVESEARRWIGTEFVCWVACRAD